MPAGMATSCAPQVRITGRTSTTMGKRITEYYKVQRFWSGLIRNKGYQVSKKLDGKDYLDVGCGNNTDPSYVNLDYFWNPGMDVCWDITRKALPFPEGRFSGIYTEHCLEHIALADCERNLKEFHRVLKPGGRLRVIVPDGEMLFGIYHERRNGGTRKMPHESGYSTMMQCINGVFRNHGHQFIYDFETMRLLLERNGFKNVEKMSFQKGHDPRLIKDTASRSEESLYVEAVK